MSNGIANKYGSYLHADGAKRTKKHGDRTFTVLIAGAYDAGIVGPEHNGIVVIDEDNRNIVLDQHCQESSGYFGPSPRQLAELDRVMQMEWKEFAAFIKSNSRYRQGSVPDIDMNVPDPVVEIEDRVIYPKEGREETGPYMEALEGRKEIIEYLTNHQMHQLDGPYSRYCLAWNIKVSGSFDTSGKNAGEEFDPDPAFDARWEEYVQTDGDLFWELADSATRHFTDKEYTLYPGINQGAYDFAKTGRSGGWLILTEFDGLKVNRLSWESMSEFEDWLQDLTDERLVHLYRLVNQLDYDLSKDRINEEMAYQYAFARENKEEEWAQEQRPAAG